MKKLFCGEETLLQFYGVAKEEVISAGFSWEAVWQEKQLSLTFSERDLLREAAWVILCSGFKESAVSKIFDYISLCFCDWESAKIISIQRSVCISTALSGFRNRRKIEAIANLADLIVASGFTKIKSQILEKPIETLSQFPYVGPVTSWHLAKNLGMDVAKNDRHLARLASLYACADAHELCLKISLVTGEHMAVVDIILWRFLSLYPKSLRAA